MGLDVARVVKRYGPRRALDGCEFAVPDGSVCALAGLNGSGKTTLLRAAAGQLPLDSGAVLVDGEVVRFARPGPVSYLAQAKPLHLALRAADVLGYAALLAGGRFDRVLGYGWLRRYDVDPAAVVGELSGGQQAQVALAAAVARKSSVVLLDEPMADLDPLAREQVAADLREQAASGRVVLVASHATAELASWIDYLVVIDAGRTVLVGRAEQLSAAASLNEVALQALRAARERREGPMTGGAA
ncbi:MAG: ATP-binding cassette domain-containing protein [Streptosporangiaceae bacterium]